jgi:Holliday junction resolvase-like predicted endonuclease
LEQELIKQKQDKFISFSQLKTWSECTHLHWIESVTKEKARSTSQYGALGIAFEDTIEKIIIETEIGERKKEDDAPFFIQRFENELMGVPPEEIDKELRTIQTEAALKHLETFEDLLEERFGEYKLISTQLTIKNKIPIEHEDYEFYFYGIVDLIIESKGIIYIIDLKVTKNGWSDYSRKDANKLLQFYLYVLFYMTQFNEEDKEIKCVYAFFNSSEQTTEFMDAIVTDDDLEWAYKKINSFVNKVYVKREHKRNAVCGRFCECEKFTEQKKENNVQ